MKVSIILPLLLFQTAWAGNVDKRFCGDNCARAVIATRKGPAQIATASADCSKFLSGAQVKEDIPVYASACGKLVNYVSACSCLGVHTATSTSTKPTTTASTTSSSKSSSVSGSSSSKSSSTSSTLSTTTSTSSTTTKSSSSSTTSSATVFGFHPSIPTSYAACMIDPTNTTETIELIDADTGISFIDVNNIATLALNTITSLTAYTFSSPAKGPAGFYDLIADNGLFVAIFDDGHVGFVSTTSNGQTYVPGAGKSTYVTSVWTVDCEGNLSLGILGGVQFQLGLGGDGASLFAQAMGTPTKRGIAQVIRIALFLKRLLHIRTDLGIDDPRCTDPEEPTPVVKWRAPPQSSNGCGSGIFIFNRVPFVSCCNTHDFCYDDCSATFLDCNSAFATCTYDKATEEYPGSDILSLVEKLGYQRLASIFAWIVESEIGRVVFDIANKNRCTCCKPGEESCASGCSNPLTDPNNCGACGNVCSTGICQNGVCSDEICNAATCNTFVPCNDNENCQCYTTADGTGFCTGGQFCAGLADCSSNADCGAGSICAVGSCCERNVCLPINCGNPAQQVLMQLNAAAVGGTTSGSKGK